MNLILDCVPIGNTPVKALLSFVHDITNEEVGLSVTTTQAITISDASTFVDPYTLTATVGSGTKNMKTHIAVIVNDESTHSLLSDWLFY